MTTTAEKLWATAQTLPEPLLAEVLDFAQFLQARRAKLQPVAQATRLIDLQGGLEHSRTFQADPLTIQQQLRDEWN